MSNITFPNDSVTKETLNKNDEVIKYLETLGFTIIPCRIGGVDEFGGRIVYFTASALPIKFESDLIAAD